MLLTKLGSTFQYRLRSNKTNDKLLLKSVFYEVARVLGNANRKPDLL